MSAYSIRRLAGGQDTDPTLLYACYPSQGILLGNELMKIHSPAVRHIIDSFDSVQRISPLPSPWASLGTLLWPALQRVLVEPRLAYPEPENGTRVNKRCRMHSRTVGRQSGGIGVVDTVSRLLGFRVRVASHVMIRGER